MSLKTQLSLAQRRADFVLRATAIVQDLNFQATLNSPAYKTTPTFTLRLWDDAKAFTNGYKPDNGWDQWHEGHVIRAHVSVNFPVIEAKIVPTFVEIPYLVISERNKDYDTLMEDWVTVSLDLGSLQCFADSLNRIRTASIGASFVRCDGEPESVVRENPVRVEFNDKSLEDKISSVLGQVRQGLYYKFRDVEDTHIKGTYSQKTTRNKLNDYTTPESLARVLSVYQEFCKSAADITTVIAAARQTASQLARLNLGVAELSFYGSEYTQSRNGDSDFVIYVKVRPTPSTCRLTVRHSITTGTDGASRTTYGLVMHDVQRGMDFASIQAITTLATMPEPCSSEKEG